MSNVKVGQVYKSLRTGKFTVVTALNPTQGVALRYLAKNQDNPGSYTFRPGGKGWELVGEPFPVPSTLQGDWWYALHSGDLRKGDSVMAVQDVAALVCDSDFQPVCRDVWPDNEAVEDVEPNPCTDVVQEAPPFDVPVDVNPTPETEPERGLEVVLGELGELLNGGKGAAMDEKRIIELIDERFGVLDRPTKVEVKVHDRDWKPVEGLVHKDFETILKAVSAGIRPMLVGPAGSGKTTIAEQVADSLGVPCYHTGAVKSEYKLVGYKDANGNYHTTPFREAFEKGGLFLFDEIDSSHPEAVVAFNAALSNGKHDFPDGIVTAHPDFKVMAAANTFGRGADRQYVGRNQLDAASLDRFMVITMDYDEKLERALVPTEQLAWVEYVQAVRKAVVKAKVRHVVSPRASLDGAKLLAGGLDRDLVVEGVIWKGLDDVNRKKVTAEMKG